MIPNRKRQVLAKDSNNTTHGSWWIEHTKNKSIITDTGLLDNRYAAWVYKDGKHHIAFVSNNIKDLQRRFKVSDDCIFILDAASLTKNNNFRVGNRRNKTK